MAKKKVVSELRVVSDFYDVKEAAFYMRVTRGTLYQMIYKQKITNIPVRYHGSKPIFVIEELKEWMFRRISQS